MHSALWMAMLHTAPSVQVVAPKAPIEARGVFFEPSKKSLPCVLGQTRRRGHECVEAAACQTECDHRLRRKVRKDERNDLGRKGDCNALRRQSLGGGNVPQDGDSMALWRRSLGGRKVWGSRDIMALRWRCLGRENPACRETYFPQKKMQKVPSPGKHGWSRRIGIMKTSKMGKEKGKAKGQDK